VKADALKEEPLAKRRLHHWNRYAGLLRGALNFS
jgi:hypothetical protein